MSKGIITFYINRDDYKSTDEQNQLIELFRKVNTELIEDAKKNGYHVMFVTTTNEATRVEKIDFDRPFPFIVRPGDVLVEDAMTKKEKEREKDKEKKERVND